MNWYLNANNPEDLAENDADAFTGYLFTYIEFAQNKVIADNLAGQRFTGANKVLSTDDHIRYRKKKPRDLPGTNPFDPMRISTGPYKKNPLYLPSRKPLLCRTSLAYCD